MQTVRIDFGDGVERELRYTVAATKRLVEKYGDVGKMLAQPKYEFLPILLEGIKNREGLTLQWMEENIDLPQLDQLLPKFWLAFTGKSIEEIAKQIADAAKNAQSAPTTPETPTIQ